MTGESVCLVKSQGRPPKCTNFATMISLLVAYFGYSVLLAGLVWPIIVRAVWSYEGFLSAFAHDPLWGVGMIDFAGGGVVHVVGGLTALHAAMILGPRRGRFEDDEGKSTAEPQKIVGQSMALQVRFKSERCIVQSTQLDTNKMFFP